MKRFMVVLFVVLFLFATVQSNCFASDALKIGIVDLFKALNESEKGKKAKADLESMIKAKQAVIEEKGKKIEALKTELEKQAAILSTEAKKTKEEELERNLRDYQRIVSDSQAEVKKKEGELTEDILKELRVTINAIAQEEGYSIVIERAEGLILYSDKSLDITDKVIKKYNEAKSK